MLSPAWCWGNSGERERHSSCPRYSGEGKDINQIITQTQECNCREGHEGVLHGAIGLIVASHSPNWAGSRITRRAYEDTCCWTWHFRVSDSVSQRWARWCWSNDHIWRTSGLEISPWQTGQGRFPEEASDAWAEVWRQYLEVSVTKGLCKSPVVGRTAERARDGPVCRTRAVEAELVPRARPQRGSRTC